MLNCLHLLQDKSITLKDVSRLMNVRWLGGDDHPANPDLRVPRVCGQ